jgi:phage regulator Rha-like protein
MEIIQSLQNRIYEIRGMRVILDKDLALIYDTDTKVLNQSVKRHLDRFPVDFKFQLTNEELESIRIQVKDLDPSNMYSRSQIVTLNTTRGGNIKYLPLAFTEQGVAMLSGILNSKKAIQMNIAIMRAFVELRRILLMKSDFKLQLDEIKERLGGHDAQLSQIYDAIENILDENAAQNKWDNRSKIGFNK